MLHGSLLDVIKFVYILVKNVKKVYFMSKKTSATNALPASALSKIKELGRRIKLARKRRGLTLQEMATLMMVSVGTLQRLESGVPGTSIGTLMTALLSLRLEDDMDRVAAMETDMVGLSYERKRLEGTSADKKKISYDF